MQIAIVAPTPVPFCIGGAEKLWWGLLDAINQYSPHQAELLKLPSCETTLEDLISSYQVFSQLDLRYFDRVISGKYPAWMVQHPHHTCYMLHRLRGLYDTYHFAGLPDVINFPQPEIEHLQRLMRQQQEGSIAQGGHDVLPALFQSLTDVMQNSSLPTDLGQFPGPFAREVVHCLDNIALSPRAIERYTAISKNLTTRKNYFPAGADVSVIYPPSSLDHFEQGSYDYLFTVSRLDNAKRLRLLISAMHHTKAPIQLKIAGTGPDAEALKALAAGDDRIEFLGFVNDSELIPLYANALVVLYVPYDEDYGLVTIEAMMSGKPVLTTTDAGGPNEFVINGETGYSVVPEPAAIAERIDYLYNHPAEAQSMGETGRKLVAGITWENVVHELLALPPRTQFQVPAAGMVSPSKVKSLPPSIIGQRQRRRLVVATTYPIYPPQGGGQSRVFNLYKNLTDHFEVEVVSFTGVGQPAFSSEISHGMTETRIPKSSAHQSQESLIEQAVGVPVTDVVMPQLYHLTPDYVTALKAATTEADVLVACHPYLYPALRALAPDKPLWYEAQDVEISLKKEIFPDGEASRRLLQGVRQVEQQCCDDSELIFTCARQDSQELGEIYGIANHKITEVANGVDTQAIRYISLSERRAAQARLGVTANPIAMFLGSWHGPNLEAVEHIQALAKQLPHVQFLVVGSVGMAFKDKPHPANVGFLGVVDEATKEIVLEIADMALNPITYGSGTNLKMLEYFAAGIPVISTSFGVRGLQVQPELHCFVASLEQFGDAIKRLESESDEQIQVRTEAARTLVEDVFAWPVIATRFIQQLSHLDLAGI